MWLVAFSVTPNGVRHTGTYKTNKSNVLYLLPCAVYLLPMARELQIEQNLTNTHVMCSLPIRLM